MFIRKKKNPRGVVSVQIIDKNKGKYGVLKTVGSSSDACEVENLYQQGKKWIATQQGNQDMFIQHERQPRFILRAITAMIFVKEVLAVKGMS